MALTANGKNNGSSRASAAKATNSPLPVIPLMMSTPPSPLGEERRTEMAKITGTTASTPSPATLRRRPKMILSSDRKNRVDTRARGGLSTRRTSAADIESLSGQGHEHVLKAWPQHCEPKYGHASIDQVGHDLFHGHITKVCCHGSGRGLNLAQSQLGQHPPGILGPIGVNTYDLHGARLQFAQRPLRHEPAFIHHPNVATNLLNLSEQVAGDEHGGAVARQITDQVPDLAGALRIQPVRRLVQHKQVTRHQER